MKVQKFPIIALALFLSLTLAACGGSEEKTDNPPKEDSTIVVKPQEQDFPVNELPESYFGKAVDRQDDASIDLPEVTGLAEVQDKYPAWLDAIVSRESIVLFANGVLNEMPNEVEFIQSKQQHFTGPDGWSAFLVHFTTRPTGAGMAILGAYKSEDDSFWMSDYAAGKMELSLANLEAKEGGVTLSGSGLWGGDAPVEFAADLEKEKATLRVKK